MRYMILDLETIAHPDAGQWLGPVKAAANLKDPAKIAKDIEERTADRDDKLGLDPDCCRIVALGWVDVGSNEPVCLMAFDEAQEKSMLATFWETYRKDANTKLVTFYGRQFDLPVLMRRSMYLGVKCPRLNLDRYRSPHIDVWDALTYAGALRTAHSLTFYAKRNGFGTLDKVDGGDMAALVKAGDWESVKSHCLSDVGLTHALANKLGLLEV